MDPKLEWERDSSLNPNENRKDKRKNGIERRGRFQWQR